MTYTQLERWFDVVTAAVRHSVPGIFDDVDVMEAHEQLRQLANATAEDDEPLLLQVNGLIDELTARNLNWPIDQQIPASDSDGQRWVGYVLNRLKTIVETHAARTKDP